MSTKTVRLLTAVAVLTLMSLVPVRATEASIIQIDFTGTYDTFGDTVFGEMGAAVPFSYSITYDTTLDTSTAFMAAGSIINGVTIAEDFYGYSKSGIIGASLTFGTHTFSVNSLKPRTFAVGYTADLWFNTNLESAAPTKVGLYFSDISGSLALGGAVRAGSLLFDTTSLVDDLRYNGVGNLTLTATTVPATVPEPASMLLLGTGLLALATRVRHTHGQR